ncbi:MAG: hypothetical protein AB7S36_11085 [Planctomycetota bacterium]
MNGLTISIERLVNGSGGDPCLYLDFPGKHNALLFDTGELSALPDAEVADTGFVLYSHFHMDHFVGFDRLLRLNIDKDKTIRVFGPPGTAQRIGARLGSYQYYRFPFMRLRFEVTEIDEPPADAPPTLARPARITRFDCQHSFEPEPQDTPVLLKRGVCHDNDDFRLHFAFVSHSVCCINYAMELKAGWMFDRGAAEEGVLKPGPWVRDVMAAMRLPATRRPQTVKVETGEFRLDDLVKQYFRRTARQKVVFMTDTRLTPESRPRLKHLAKGATRLYADCYYPDDMGSRADKYGHMTASQCAGLARDAKVKELVLIHIGNSYHSRAAELLAQARTVFANTRMQFGEQTW